MAGHTLIHKRAVRQFLLDHARKSRAHPYTQVAGSVYARIEQEVRDTCRQIVREQPSMGKTIR